MSARTATTTSAPSFSRSPWLIPSRSGAGRGPLSLTCDDPQVPTDRRNLAWKAASLLWREARLGRGEPRDVAIHLQKRIPAEAGLGGGSADAAVTLLGLNRLWKLKLDAASLSRLGARIGADVPFFLVGGTALGLGRGDDIYPLTDMPKVYVVLIRPGFGVSTVEAYRWYDEEARLPRKAVRSSRCRRRGRPGPRHCGMSWSHRWSGTTPRLPGSGRC